MRIVVIGGTGNVGRHLIPRLAGNQVRVVARNVASAQLPPWAEAVPADVFQPESLTDAVSDADAAFLLWPAWDTEDVTGAATVVDLLLRSVPKVVFLSAIRPKLGFWGAIEDQIEAHGADWTFLRCGGFMSNTVIWADQIRKGTVHWPYPEVVRPFVSERDISAVAAVSLTAEGHSGQRYVLTGPETFTLSEYVTRVGGALGREVRCVTTGREEARRVMLESSIVPFVDGTLEAWETFGRDPEDITSTVQDVTGAPPQYFSEWVEENVGMFKA